MNDPLLVAVTTIALLVLSALFVIIEFALLGARRHRLEELAATSPSARAALRGMNDLTLMLAGSQLGITFCTFALDRKSTRLNSSHVAVSYAVFCLLKKNK